MIRFFRKSTSMVVIIAILMSVCAIAFGSFLTTSAATPTGVTVDFEDKTIGNSPTGYRNNNGQFKVDPDDAENTTLYIPGILGANPTIRVHDSFELLAGQKYTVTFKYKVAKDAGDSTVGATGCNFKLDLMLTKSGALTGSGADNYIRTIVSGVVSKNINEFQGYNPATNKLTDDTQWFNASTTFVADTGLVGLGFKYLGIKNNTPATADTSCYIDDIVIEPYVAPTPADNISYDLNNGLGVTYVRDGSVAEFIDDGNGGKFLSAAGSTTNNNTYVRLGFDNTKPLTNSKSDNSTSYNVKSGVKYTVSWDMKFPAGTQFTARSVQIGLCLTDTAGNMKNNNIWSYLLISEWGLTQDVASTSDSIWKRVSISYTPTAAEDGTILHIGAFRSLEGGKPSNSLPIYIDNINVLAGDFYNVKLETNGGTVSQNTLLVKAANSVNLPVPQKAAFGFEGWYTTADFQEGTKVSTNSYIPTSNVTLYAKYTEIAASITLNNCGTTSQIILADGSTAADLPRPVSPNSSLFFEGWYTDTNFTTPVTNIVKGSHTFYAKYNGHYLQFNHEGWSDTSSSMALVTDPSDSSNKVLRFRVTSGRTNFMFPAYDVDGSAPLCLETKSNYRYSFRMKVADGSRSGDWQLMFGDASAYNNEKYTRTVIAGTGASFDAQTNGDSEWIEVSGTFSTGETFYLERVKWSYQNHLLMNMYQGQELDKSATIYIDDFMLVKEITEKPAGSTAIYFKSTGTKVYSMFGYEGDAIVLPANPTAPAAEFMGWYTDISLTNEFNATTFGTEDITLYAKWKATSPVVIDFENNYDKKIMLGRGKYVSDATGNHYIEVKTEYKPQNDNNTLYHQGLNINSKEFYLTDGETYTITLKYRLRKGTLRYGIVTSDPNNDWSNTVSYSGGSVTNADGKWNTLSFTIKVNNVNGYAKGTWERVVLGIGGDLDCDIDDVTITNACNMMNVYGDTIYIYNTNGGNDCKPTSGNIGDKIPPLAVPVREGYSFAGWYTDAKLENKFSETTFKDKGVITLYAAWILGKFVEGFEDYPESMIGAGISNAYMIYNSTLTGFDKSNVYEGNASVFRDGKIAGAKNITLCRDENLEITEGKQYTLTFYVKPIAITNVLGSINLIGMKKCTDISSPENSVVIKKVNELKAGTWQKVSYTFTAKSGYIGIQSTAGNDMYFDNFTLELSDYQGSTTGDNSVSPIVITIMIVLAAGAMLLTSKKVFSK